MHGLISLSKGSPRCSCYSFHQDWIPNHPMWRVFFYFFLCRALYIFFCQSRDDILLYSHLSSLFLLSCDTIQEVFGRILQNVFREGLNVMSFSLPP